MPNKMERFTRGARQVLTFAQEEAEQLQHNYIGTEHILIGLIREEESVAARTLRDLGLEIPRVEDLMKRISPASKRTASEHLDLSPNTKQLLELAVEEARRMGHHYIGTEHLLLGLARQDSIAVDILKRLNVPPEEVRRQTRRVLQENPLQPPSVPSPVVPRTSTVRTPLIDQLSADLTLLAEEGKLDPFVGREAEIARLIEILQRRENNGVLLIGAPGVGKTAIIRGLAQRIVDKSAPPSLHEKRVLLLHSSSLIAGTAYRGQFEERVRRVIAEAQAAKFILFIDQAQMLVSLGVQKDIAFPENLAEGMPEGKRLSAADIFKPALEDGLIHLIGAMTAEEYEHLEKIDLVLARRFGIVQVNEPSVDESISILQAVKPSYETHHQVTITDEAINTTIRLSVRHLTNRVLPGKAIGLMDEAASRVHLYRSGEIEPKVTRQDIIDVIALWTGKPTSEIAAVEADQ